MTDRLLILNGREVAALLTARELEVLAVVRQAYEAHSRGLSSLPHSTFLRFPDHDRDRIIALPAFLGAEFQVAGLKWIASIPANIERGLERATAVILLNARETGHLQAILEGSVISKQRTAASAALGAQVLRRGRAPETIGVVGCGPIGSEIAHYLSVIWPAVTDYRLCDLRADRAAQFRDHLRAERGEIRCEIVDLETLLATADLVVFATTAVVPYVTTLEACRAGTTILHISLRDLQPEVILKHHNVVDDLDHVDRAQTSIHLASSLTGQRDFVHANLGDLLREQKELPPNAPGQLSIFSPFGLGILDLAVAQLVYRLAQEQGVGLWLDAFLPA